MTGKPHFTDAQVIKALRQNKRDVRLAAATLGCSRSTVDRYIRLSQNVRDFYHGGADRLLSRIRNPEEVVRQYLVTGNLRATAPLMVYTDRDGDVVTGTTVETVRARLVSMGVDIVGYPTATVYVQQDGELMHYQLSRQARVSAAQRAARMKVAIRDPDLHILSAVIETLALNPA